MNVDPPSGWSAHSWHCWVSQCQAASLVALLVLHLGWTTWVKLWDLATPPSNLLRYTEHFRERTLKSIDELIFLVDKYGHKLGYTLVHIDTIFKHAQCIACCSGDPRQRTVVHYLDTNHWMMFYILETHLERDSFQVKNLLVCFLKYTPDFQSVSGGILEMFAV
jgi:hypothetical protein